MRCLQCPAVLKTFSSLQKFDRVSLRRRFGAKRLSPISDLCYGSFRRNYSITFISSVSRVFPARCSLRLATLLRGSLRQFFFLGTRRQHICRLSTTELIFSGKFALSLFYCTFGAQIFFHIFIPTILVFVFLCDYCFSVCYLLIFCDQIH